MRSRKRIFLMFFCTFLRSGSKGVPGWSQGPSQGPSRVKFAPKWVSKWLQNHQKSYLQAFWKRFSKTRALSMFPNSSGPFFSLFLFMQREILCHIYPSKVPTLIHLARGKNLRWMPPRCLSDASQFPPSPGGVEDGLPPGAQTKTLRGIFWDLKKWFPKVVPKVPKWSPKTDQNR